MKRVNIEFENGSKIDCEYIPFVRGLTPYFFEEFKNRESRKQFRLRKKHNRRATHDMLKDIFK